MKKAALAIFFLLSVQFCAQAQNWQQVGTKEFSHYIDCLFSDTSTGQLYNVGYYQYLDSQPVSGISIWDGTEWQEAAFADPGFPPKQLAKFQGVYYLCNGSHLWKWDGIEWDTAGFTGSTGFVGRVFNDGDSVLYAMGDFSSVNGVTASNVAKFDGSTWSALSNTQWQVAISCACRYQGDLYFGGGFYNTSMGIWRIARWDGSTWFPVGGGITGSLGAAFCMEEYNGELYVGGYMETALGNPGNFIARWDGTNWSQVGGGMAYGQVFDLEVFNGELWAAGQFNDAGGVPGATYIAKYDGLDWCSIGTLDNAVSDIEIYNGELYIAGGFWTVDGDSMSKVAKWIGLGGPDSCGHLSTGLDEQGAANFKVNVFPNPVTDKATFQFLGEQENKTVLIFDQIGREIWNEETEENKIEFLAEAVEPGMYFYRVEQSGQVLASGKFIIQ